LLIAANDANDRPQADFWLDAGEERATAGAVQEAAAAELELPLMFYLYRGWLPGTHPQAASH